MPWREVNLTGDLLLFTTAKLDWRPLDETEPEGAQIATLWGDPRAGAFGAVMRRPGSPTHVYTLVRREAAS